MPAWLYRRTDAGKVRGGAYQELPGIRTVNAAQWGLNAICALDFIPDALPAEWICGKMKA